MIPMGPRLRTFMLLVHVSTGVGLLGAVAAFLALAVVGVTGGTGELARAAYLCCDILARFVVVPLTVAGLVIGIIESLGTRWGLIKYYWIIAKLVLTALALVVLLLQLPVIAAAANAAAADRLGTPEIAEPRMAMVLHSAGGLVVLLLVTVLSIYKPRGRTPLGQTEPSSLSGNAPL